MGVHGRPAEDQELLERDLVVDVIGHGGRPDLVTQALVLLERHGLVLAAAGSARAWKITAAGRLMLARRRRPRR